MYLLFSIEDTRLLKVVSLGNQKFTLFEFKLQGTSEEFTWEVGTEALVDTASCIPTLSRRVFQGHNTTVGEDSEVLHASYSFEYGAVALQSREIFTPPKGCKPVEMSKSERNKRRFHHLVRLTLYGRSFIVIYRTIQYNKRLQDW